MRADPGGGGQRAEAVPGQRPDAATIDVAEMVAEQVPHDRPRLHQGVANRRMTTIVCHRYSARQLNETYSGGAQVRIAVLGGGTGGLLAALLAKRGDPAREVTVFERNLAGDTFGFGVVFSDATLD